MCHVGGVNGTWQPSIDLLDCSFKPQGEVLFNNKAGEWHV